MKKNLRKIKMSVENLVSVSTHMYTNLNNVNLFYILYSLKLNIIKGRAMPFLEGIGLPLCAFNEKVFHKHMRCGP